MVFYVEWHSDLGICLCRMASDEQQDGNVDQVLHDGQQPEWEDSSEEDSSEDLDVEWEGIGSEEESDNYHSEELRSPISSDDENDGNERPVFPQFKEGAQFGQVHLEVGMEFATMNTFKKALKDYTIYHGREIKWKKMRNLGQEQGVSKRSVIGRFTVLGVK